MIYGLTGKKQSGKSTACTYIESKLPSVRINFKDGLVAHLRLHFRGSLDAIVDTMNRTDWNGMKPWSIERLFQEKPPLMRKLMQDVGQMMRGQNPNHWVEIWEASVDAYPDMTIVTDDVRYLNEAEAIRRRGGKIIRIERTDLIQHDTHQSEVEMDSIIPDDTISVKTGEHQKLYDYLDFIITPVTQTNLYDYTSETRTNVTG